MFRGLALTLHRNLSGLDSGPDPIRAQLPCYLWVCIIKKIFRIGPGMTAYVFAASGIDKQCKRRL